MNSIMVAYYVVSGFMVGVSGLMAYRMAQRHDRGGVVLWSVNAVLQLALIGLVVWGTWDDASVTRLN